MKRRKKQELEASTMLRTMWSIVMIFLLILGDRIAPINSLNVGDESDQDFETFSIDHETPSQRTNRNQAIDVAAKFSAVVEQDKNLTAATSHYVNSQAQKFRVNVSNLCERNQMRITLRLNKPFYGLIHTKDKRRKSGCFVEGTGDQTYVMPISYTLIKSDSNYCGVVSHAANGVINANSTPNASTNKYHQQQQTLSVILVVRLHKSIEFSEDRYFLLSCANRCSRQDCSSTEGHRAQSSARSSNSTAKHAKLQESESIVLPVLKSSDQVLNKLSSISSQRERATEEGKCDYLLGLRFQWMVKLCWVLSSLLLIALCCAFYSCLNMNKIRLQRIQSMKVQGSAGGGNRSAQPAKVSRIQPTKVDSKLGDHQFVFGSDHEQSNCESVASICGDPRGNVNDSHAVATSLVPANGRLGVDRVDELTTRPQQYQINLMLPPQQQQVFGRSVDVPQSQALVVGRHSGGGRALRRRRSISGSVSGYDARGRQLFMAAEFEDLHQFDHKHSQESQPNNGQDSLKPSTGKWPLATLGGESCSRSKSQTTIHYDQFQDPFMATPFRYQPTVTGSQLTQIKPLRHLPNQAHQTPNANSYISESTRRSSGEISSLGPRYLAPMKLTNTRFGAGINQQHTSQFDPQNSRSLISLIQQKHQQQLASASRTAAILEQQQQAQQLWNQCNNDKSRDGEGDTTNQIQFPRLAPLHSDLRQKW